MNKLRERLAAIVCTVAFVVLATSGTLKAQQRTDGGVPRILTSVPADPNTYGITSSIVQNLQPQDFRPVVSSTDVTSDEGGVFRVALGSGYVTAPLRLPTGAVVYAFEYFYFDGNTVANPDAAFTFTNTAGALTDIAPVNFFPNVSNGNTSLFVTLQTPVTINNLTTHYSVRFNLSESGVNGTTGLKRVRVYYRLQVSPPPASATFADVPVGSPQHQFVEALVAAGITAGCGGGNYCPNAPVTRGQMAVFLAAALGLHWPN